MVPSRKKVEFYRNGHSNVFRVYILDGLVERSAMQALEMAGYVNISMEEDSNGVWGGEHEEVYMAFKTFGIRNVAFGSPDPGAMERLCAAYRLLDGRQEFEVKKQYRP